MLHSAACYYQRTGKSMEYLSPLFSWQVFHYFFSLSFIFFLWFHAVFQPLLSFLTISVLNATPSLSNTQHLPIEPTPVIASPLDISAEFMGLDLFSSNQTSGSCAQALTLGGKHRNL